jgi:putative hydrolase
VSTPDRGNPFEGMPIFGDLAKLFTTQGPVNWEVARQIAAWVASEGGTEGNVDPLDRIRIGELARVAELHVAEATGLVPSVTGRGLTVRPVPRGEWALLTIEAYRPLLERLASSLGRLAVGMPEQTGDEGDAAGAASELLGNLTELMSPMLLGMQSGFMVGYLARRSLGQYDVPIPRSPSDELVVVVPNLDAFARDWSLPPDDLRLWVCLHVVAHHAVLGRPHVRARLEELLGQYVGGFQADASALEARLADINPADPSSWEQLVANPESLLGVIQTEAQRQLLSTLEALISAVEGYVDHVMDTVGGRLVGSYGALAEAFHRRRVERGEGDRLVERLLGVELSQRQYDRGTAFVKGVLERAGEAGLARLWTSARELPTPAEIDAPGLWLERIDLPES